MTEADVRTEIKDVIAPSNFNTYVQLKTAEKDNFIQSGVMGAVPGLSVVGRTVNMPYWNDLEGASEVLSDQQALVPTKLSAGQDIAAVHYRGKAWSVNDLAVAFAGNDPAGWLAQRIASYNARENQRIAISSLKGVFASESMSGRVFDASSKKISAQMTVDAQYLLGDCATEIKAMAVHSKTMAVLVKQDLIDYARSSEGQPDFPVYMGKRVIVDDSLPSNKGVYSSFLFGEGAFGYGVGHPKHPTSSDYDLLAGDDVLALRWQAVIHPRGVRFTDASVAGAAPSNDELEKKENWQRVYDPKQIRIVMLKHLVA